MSNHKKHMKMKARGGAMSGRDAYSGGSSNVAKEAREMKGGGKVAGSKGKHRIKKASGGSVGADKHPFSSAYRAASEAK
jgi:hypothetical protein